MTEGLERALGVRCLCCQLPVRSRLVAGLHSSPQLLSAPPLPLSLTAPILHGGKPLAALWCGQAPLLLPVLLCQGLWLCPHLWNASLSRFFHSRAHYCVQLGSRNNTSEVPSSPASHLQFLNIQKRTRCLVTCDFNVTSKKAVLDTIHSM